MNDIWHAAVVRALAALPDETVIDGEVVAIDDTGRPSFNALQNYSSSKVPIVYYVFDVLILAGRNVMSEHLSARRDLLQRHILPKLGEPIRECPELNASLRDLIDAVRSHGLEGVVAKRLDSGYEPGQRSGAWRKMRINQAQEFVIAGYTPSSKNFDALIFGRPGRRGEPISRSGDIQEPVAFVAGIWHQNRCCSSIEDAPYHLL